MSPIDATVTFDMRNMGDLGQVTTRIEECITWLALRPGKYGRGLYDDFDGSV